jgi:nitroreductase
LAAPFDLEAADRLLSTTRAVRKRLDLSRPVEPGVILECIRLAQQAPTASNQQSWRWVVVTDPELRSRVSAIYEKLGQKAFPRARAQVSESDPQTRRVYDSAEYLAEHLAEVPALVIPCIRGRLDPKEPMLALAAAALYGSIYPAVWSFQLALRSRGLGSVLTTLHLVRESEVAQLLGIPPDVSQVGLLPVAYTRGTDFKPATRPPAEEITHWNGWTES